MPEPRVATRKAAPRGRNGESGSNNMWLMLTTRRLKLLIENLINHENSKTKRFGEGRCLILMLRKGRGPLFHSRQWHPLFLWHTNFFFFAMPPPNKRDYY